MNPRLPMMFWSCLAAFFLAACSDDDNANDRVSQFASQQALADFANDLNITYEVIDNRPDANCDPDIQDGLCFRARLNLTTTVDIPENTWQLWFSQIVPIYATDNPAFRIEHIQGDLHKLTPTPQFSGFTAGETQTIEFTARFWDLSETDPMPNYYVVTDRWQPETIASTQPANDAETGLETRPYVSAFNNAIRQFKRTEDDQTQWAKPDVLYANNTSYGLTQLPSSATHAQLIPTPTTLESLLLEDVDISNGLTLNLSGIEQTELQAAIDHLSNIGIGFSDSGVPLTIQVAASTTALDTTDESYQLRIEPTGISIQANSAAGAFYGLQSIASVYRPPQPLLPALQISDNPRYEFRGMHLDIARNFASKAFILQLLEQMSAYKLNKLHLHLADDEGWRLEIPDLPELTDISSRTCHDLTETQCLIPQLGRGKNPDSPANGYLTANDYIEIVEYADARFIDVIPSLDTPAHSRAAVKAMQARYHRLKAAGDDEAALEYLLTDFDDTSEYLSVQYYNDNVINPCMPSAYTFFDKLIEEVSLMHAQAGQPLTRFHIGADETPNAWVDSPVCKAFLEENPDISDPGIYFIEQISNRLAERNIIPAGWSDGISAVDPTNMPARVQANSWEYLPWGFSNTNQLINQNWEVVLSTPEAVYFDFPYEADPKERGYYWGSRNTNIYRVFSFMPDNLPLHAEIWKDRTALPYESDDRLQRDGNGDTLHAPVEPGKAVIGIQGQLWSETQRTDRQKSYMVFPRLLALAERAWYRGAWEPDYDHQGALYNKDSGVFTEADKTLRNQAFNRFANTLSQKELLKLDAQQIFYRIPSPGAVVDNGVLTMNNIYPSLTLEYRTPGSDWQTYQGPTDVSEGASAVEVRARSADGSRPSRILTTPVINKTSENTP